MKWHKISPPCPQCETEPVILSVSIAADGEILVQMVCAKCGVRLGWKSNIVNLIRGAIVADIQEDAIQHKPIRPPMKDPCEIIADNAWLHSLGIDPNEPRRLQ